MDQPKYQIVIWWSDTPGDQVFIASVPELPRCMAHGDTHQEAFENIMAAMRAYLEVLHKTAKHRPPRAANSLP